MAGDMYGYSIIFELKIEKSSHGYKLLLSSSLGLEGEIETEQISFERVD